MSDYLRARAAARRQAALGQAPLPVYRPAASRFLIAGLCAWILWQPLKGAEVADAEQTPRAAVVRADITSAVAPTGLFHR